MQQINDAESFPGRQYQLTMALLNREEVLYTKYYCEENVWCLCDKIKKYSPTEIDFFSAVFISNDEKQVPLFFQRSAKRSGVVIWDYHVILLHNPKNNPVTWVYDLDSTLDYPCKADEYVHLALQQNETMLRYFRVVPASDFLAHFASDRSHMMSSDGKWMAPPPSYPCISTDESQNNIQNYISMDRSEPQARGVVMDYREFSLLAGCARDS